ncbi:MAG: CPBP family intramembrane metalloprotease [Lewinellaceae bacterium]|nr:CPBP family intramembrane metalloprotease [Lewinellaceae bacterium]
MPKLLLALFLQLLLISPLIFLSLNKDANKWKYLLPFALFYFMNTSLLALPNFMTEFRFIEGDWNWSGKTYAIVGSLLFYFLIRKSLGDYNYITLKQKAGSFRSKTYILIVVVLVLIGLTYFLVDKSSKNFTDLLFQSTMPGIDEELAYRGIMLGLLCNALNPRLKIGTLNLENPALIITSILFGFGHSFHFNPNWSIYQDWFEFFDKFAIGLLLGWMTIKSGSIVMSIFTHNLINTFPIMVQVFLRGR